MAVAPGGYAWWYLDALSDDGRHALTLIGFVGSVFSPYYAWARRSAQRRGEPPPAAENHCAMNLAIYGPGGRWAMTERGTHDLSRQADAFAVGPSSMRWVGDALHIEVDEWCVPIPRRLRGTLVVHPQLPPSVPFALDAGHRHEWQPIAARARIEARFDEPALNWSGEAYLDSNRGSRPLEADFADWTWSRAPFGHDACAALYDVHRRDGSALSLALRFGADGLVEPFDPPRPAPLPRTLWTLARATRSDNGARVLQTVEDAPFYSRSIVAARWLGQDVRAFHESLSLDRFDTPWMRFMLPFRMPRRASNALR